MRRHIPNLLTCCNLLCGVLGIIYLFDGDGVYPVAYFVWLAGLVDFLDGFVARLLKVHSPIGKELDSLADMVTFGALPAIFMYKLIEAHSPGSFLSYSALLIVVCSALRLAKFNIDTTQSDSFKGLPTPANTFLLTGLPFLQDWGADFVFNPIPLTIISVVFSLLMVSRIELFALKFKDFTWQSNKMRFTFLFLSVLLLVAANFAAIPLIVILYIVMSFIGLIVSGTNG